MKDTDIQSLSALPSPDVIDFEGPEYFNITLPVYCLSFFKSQSWKANGPAFLIFTDFTTVHNSAISYGLLSSRIPKNYVLEAEYKDFDRSKLFSCSVPAFKCPSVVRNFRKFKIPIMNDFSDEDGCKFEDKGIFMNLNMTLKTYKGRIESNFNSLTLLSDEIIDELYPPSSSKRKILVNLLRNFKSTASSSIYKEACKVLHIDSIIGTLSEANNYPSRQRSFEESTQWVEPPQKIQKKPNGMNLLFQQHTSNDDTQGPISSQTQNQTTSQSDLIRDSRNINKISVNLEVFDQFLVNKVNISQILQMVPTYDVMKKERIFEVDIYIRGMIPMLPFIVKPYERTLKVAPFKLVVRDGSTPANLFLEFLTDKEICDFLGISEVEQILHEYESITATFENLISDPSRLVTGVKIKVSLDTNHPTMFRPYWVCITPMKDMVRSRGQK